MKSITLDMDGTIAQLYAVENWLPKLRNYDASPYAEALPLGNMSNVARQLNRLARHGYKLCIVSWGSKPTTDKNADANYLQAVAKAKKKWLGTHLKSVHFDEILIVPYGTPKSTVCPYYGDDALLFDDEEQNRVEWGENAFSEKELASVLRTL